MVVVQVAGQRVIAVYTPPEETSKLDGAKMIEELFVEVGFQLRGRWVCVGDFNDHWHEAPSGAVLSSAGGRPLPFNKPTRWASEREVDWIIVNNDDEEDEMTYHDDIRISDHIALEVAIRIGKRLRGIPGKLREAADFSKPVGLPAESWKKCSAKSGKKCSAPKEGNTSEAYR